MLKVFEVEKIVRRESIESWGKDTQSSNLSLHWKIDKNMFYLQMKKNWFITLVSVSSFNIFFSNDDVEFDVDRPTIMTTPAPVFGHKIQTLY